MKLVKFNRAMRSTGETRVLPDEIADRQIAEGEATFVPSVFDHVAETPAKRPRVLPNLTRKTR